LLVNASTDLRRWCGASRPSAGFTLVELLTVLVVLGILAAIAMPSLADVMAGQRIRAAATDLMTSLLMARSEAIKRNAQVAIAPQAAGDWTSGWRVATVATDEQVDKRNAPGYRVAVTLAPETIVYERSGRLTAVGTVQVQISDDESHPGVVPRCLTIDPSGLPHVETGACS
jgi:type IV fimbrial biogenesis protein FimT